MRNDAILLLVHVVYAVLVSAAIFGLCVLVKSLCRKILRKWENKNFLNNS